MQRLPRIFMGLTEVSGYYAQLRKGFLARGLVCEHIPIQSHRFAYEESVQFAWPARLSRYFVRRRLDRTERDRLGRALWLIPVLASRLLLFVWALGKFDVFVMGGGSSFFRFLELPILRLFGRQVIYVLHGTDSRPAYMDGAFYQSRHVVQREIDDKPPPLDTAFVDACIAETRRRRRDVAWIERFANLVICGPGFAQLLEGSFINFAAIGIPFSPGESLPEVQQRDSSRVRILHATSDRVNRGSRITEQLLQRLIDRGLPIDFISVTGVPHKVVLEELSLCDFVIDGQWADTPIAGFGTEAAGFGKPVVMGGYYAQCVLQDMDPRDVAPTCFTLPDDMEATIERLVQNKAYRLEMGARLKAFVSENLTPSAVADKYLSLIRGDIPVRWWNRAGENGYILGGGLPSERIRSAVQAIIRQRGTSALQLDHQPALRDQLLAFASGNSTP